MSTQYEIEHNIKPGERRTDSRRPDMSSFVAFLNQISTGPSSATASAEGGGHNNPHATPTPVDAAALFRLVQEQMQSLFSTARSDGNRTFLESLITALDVDIDHPPTEIAGVDQAFLDALDRVPKKRLKKDEACPICAEVFLDDPYCLVVELPCHQSHKFDLECVSPWLQSKGTCPMCRKDLTMKKAPPPVEDDEDEEDPDMLYA